MVGLFAVGFVLMYFFVTTLAMCGVLYYSIWVWGCYDAGVFVGGLCGRGEVVQRCVSVGRTTLLLMRKRGEWGRYGVSWRDVCCGFGRWSGG